MEQKEIEEGKTIAIISYILIIGVLIAMSMNSENKNKYASFHIRQGLGLTITFISLGVIISNFNSINIAAPMWIFILVLMSYGIFSAAKGNVTPLPIVGKLFQKFLNGIS
jgi:uncharacterized membrane protein